MTADIGGLRIHYRQAGDGALLVMLHGWGANGDLFAGIEAFTMICEDETGYRVFSYI